MNTYINIVGEQDFFSTKYMNEINLSEVSLLQTDLINDKNLPDEM